MSWQKQVKLLYSFTLIVAFFTIGNFLASFIFKEYLKYSLITITIITLILIYYFLDKVKNKKVLIVLILILTSLIIYITFNTKVAIISIAFLNVSILINLYKLENYSCYEDCKSSLGAIIIVSMILCTFGSYISNTDSLNYNLKAYILYFILYILNLRETMRYDNGIINKNAKYQNIMIGIFSLLLIENNIIINIIKMLKRLLENILNFVAQQIVVGLRGPLEWILEIVSSKATHVTIRKSSDQMKETLKAPKGSEELAKNALYINYELLEKIIKIIFIVLIIYILILAIKKYMHKIYFKNENKTYEEYSEKIKKSKDEKKKKILISKKIRKVGDKREEILYTYKKFQMCTNKIGIFKKYMTPTQLKNIYKIKVNADEDIDKFTDIYNEVKFSNHEVNNEKLLNMKKQYKKIKKKIEDSKLQKGD